jgi:hypothetical protein
MNKSTFFSGQPVLSQLISLIPDAHISRISHMHQSDRYYKTFKSRDHLIAMLYACFHNCSSLREVVTGLEASYNKLIHLGIRNIPRRSTLSDANSRRPVAFFRDLYHELYSTYYPTLPDSRRKSSKKNRLRIMDSTTVSLFSDVMRGAGSYRIDGRKKGGVKAHVLLDAKNDVPSLIHISESARNDRVFMEKLSLKKDDILVFDKGYQYFAQWQIWTDKGISWVTRLNDNQFYEILDQKKITVSQQQEGVCGDQKIFLGRGTLSSTQQITVRLVSYYVPEHNKIYHYLTNNFRFKATTVAGIYKDRWQIESFFKRIKQNNPLRYFLGDSENAICIQLWCAFIKDLLIKIVKDQLKRKWAFSNISAMIRHHLMNYLNLFAFLNDPEKMRNNPVPEHAETKQILLFSP